MISDVRVTSIIFDQYFKTLRSCLKVDVAVVGAGPAGLTAAYYLAKGGYRVAVFEKKMSIGGGMWGGGIMFNVLVFQEQSREILDEIGIAYSDQGEGYYSADAVLAAATLAAKTAGAGAKIFNLLAAEDVLVEGGNRITGLVLNWSAVQLSNLHVDPVAMEASYVIDATGHDCQIAAFVQNKNTGKLNTPTGKIMGEKSMWAEEGEKFVVDYTGEVFPGLYIAGMAVSAVHGGYRMGPIFGGMLLSGRKAAVEIMDKLRGSD